MSEPGHAPGTSAQQPGRTEFVALVALLMCLVALSIDAMLPALPAIGEELGALGGNRPQLVVSSLFIGLSLGTLVYGPVSDSLGRKPTIYAGLALFALGCLLSMFATSFTTMLVGRVLQGLGAAGPRIVTLAMVRDLYSGAAMARIMSSAMTVFILVPALAPAVGQAVLLVAPWRAIFLVFLVLALVAALWLVLRQPETLPAGQRRPLRPRVVLEAFVEVVKHRQSLRYILATGLVFGAFVGYLSSAQQIFQDLYGVGARFPLYFGILALAIGVASLTNSRLVMRVGMGHLSRRALLGMFCIGCAALPLVLGFDGKPPLALLMVILLACFFCFGTLFGNLNALALEPMGHIAGSAASVIGALSTAISIPLGALVGLAYQHSGCRCSWESRCSPAWPWRSSRVICGIGPRADGG
jgi:DHA1 family bicyclomycin/chloramphenicol resistance-like MFS transporter